MSFEGLDGFRAVGHGVRAQPQFLQDAQGHLLVGDVVFGQQDAHRAPAHLADRVARDDGLRLLCQAVPASTADRQSMSLRMPHRLGQVGGKPDLLHPLASPRSPSEDNSTRRVSFSFSSALMARPRAAPSMPGICMSRMATWKGSPASWPDRAPAGPGAIGASSGRTPQASKLGHQHLAIGGVVVHDQDMHPAKLGRRR